MQLIDETYVINMDKEIGRLIAFDSMMNSDDTSPVTLPGALHWKYTRMPAINGRDLNKGVTTVYRTCEDDIQLFNCQSTITPENIIVLKEKYLTPNNWLAPGEVGCLLSHVFLWERVANDPALNRIVIFEDDARTHVDLVTIHKLIANLYEYLHNSHIPEPDMLYLGKALDECTRYEQIWKNVYRSYHPLCLHAYIITKDGARKLLRRLPYDVPIDLVPIHAIADKGLDVMTFHPSLYFQDIINNTSSLRELGKALNLMTECLVDEQHISNYGMKFLIALLIAFVAVLILYLIYTFVWIEK